MSGDPDDEYGHIYALETALQVANREINALKATVAALQVRVSYQDRLLQHARGEV